MTGPNLDDVLAGQDPSQIEESIVNPGAQISPGYGNLMPNSFGASLTPDQLQQLVDYLVAGDGRLRCPGRHERRPARPAGRRPGGSGGSSGPQGN